MSVKDVKHPGTCLQEYRDAQAGSTTVAMKGLKGFPCGSAGKESACNAGDPDSTPRLGRSPGEGNGYPLQYSVLENSWTV